LNALQSLYLQLFLVTPDTYNLEKHLFIGFISAKTILSFKLV